MTAIKSIRYWAEQYADQYANGDVDRLHNAMRRAAIRQKKFRRPRATLRAQRVGRDWACSESEVLAYLNVYHSRSSA